LEEPWLCSLCHCHDCRWCTSGLRHVDHMRRRFDRRSQFLKFLWNCLMCRQKTGAPPRGHGPRGPGFCCEIITRSNHGEPSCGGLAPPHTPKIIRAAKRGMTMTLPGNVTSTACHNPTPTHL
jgi:hypothetical protein